MDYLVWYDENKQKTAAEKIQEAIAAYVARFTVVPDLVLVSASEEAEVSGVLIRPQRTVQPNSFWVGMQEEE